MNNKIISGAFALLLALSLCLFYSGCKQPGPDPTPTTVASADTDIVVHTIVAPLHSNIYVSTTGVDASGNGTLSHPYLTVAYAAAHAVWGDVINIQPGVYTETQSVVVQPGVSLVGLGADETGVTITAGGLLPLPPGVFASNSRFSELPWGSLIELVSDCYVTGDMVASRYGSPDQMSVPTNGSQQIKNLTLDGNSRTVRNGLWVECRSNITIKNVDFSNFAERGCVVTRGDMYYYTALPEGKWIRNIIIDSCNFSNNAKQLGTSLATNNITGNLNIGGMNGAIISNIAISEDQGYGIKFMHLGNYRNTIIHDCNMYIPESEPYYGECISIELWNPSYGNVLYNISTNTWFSIVSQTNQYQPTASRPSNVIIHDVAIVDGDGASGIEAMEIAVSGLEIYNSLIQDKGFGLGIWGGLGAGGWDHATVPINNIKIHNNVFTNQARNAWSSNSSNFGKGAAIYMPDIPNNIQIYNNVFDNVSHGVYVGSPNTTNVQIGNNLFIGRLDASAIIDDVHLVPTFTNTSPNFSIFNNLKYSSVSGAANVFIVTTNANSFKHNNIDSLGSDPVSAFANDNSYSNFPPPAKYSTAWAGSYVPTGSSSAVVNAGKYVGLLYLGSAPDIGWLESY